MKGIRILGCLFLFAGSLMAQTAQEDMFSVARLPYLKQSKLIQIASSDSSSNADYIVLRPGETKVLAAMEGPGIIERIWVTISAEDRYFLRRLRLTMYWDGEKNPSVDVPIGDFFGTGFGYFPYSSPFLGMTSGGYCCFFPMPFEHSARIELINETGHDVSSFYYHIDYQKLEKPLDSAVAYFHCQWRREIRTSEPTNYVILDAKGEGHVVGVNLNMQSYDGGLSYLEGDEMIYVDGERHASIDGTGTEDFFTSGWYFNHGPYAAPHQGLIVKNDSLGRIAAYRYFVGDVIPFKKSIHMTIEHGDRNSETADYSSTVYWYQKEPHVPFPPMLPAPLRIPLRVVVPNGATEAEAIPVKGHGSSVEDMSAFGPDWSGMKQRRFVAGAPRDSFTMAIPVGLDDKYTIDLYRTLGPDYGTVSISSQGIPLASYDGYDADVTPGGRVRLGTVSAVRRTIPLTITISGHNAHSSGYAAGIDAFVLEPVRTYIPSWYLIGPFDNPRNSAGERLGLDNVYDPERKIDLDKSYKGVNGQEVRWQEAGIGPDGRVNLYGRYSPSELVVSYALTYLDAPKETDVTLLLGSDDGVKAFLNGKEILRKLLIRVAEPDQDTLSLHLHKGRNALLLKIENNFGGYGFFARILDPTRAVVAGITQEQHGGR